MREYETARCPVCGGFLGDWGACVTVGCDGEQAGEPAAGGVCGQAIDAAVAGACEKAHGHPGPCRAFSLEQAGAETLTHGVCCVCGCWARVCCDDGYVDLPGGGVRHDCARCRQCCGCLGAQRWREQERQAAAAERVAALSLVYPDLTLGELDAIDRAAMRQVQAAQAAEPGQAPAACDCGPDCQRWLPCGCVCHEADL